MASVESRMIALAGDRSSDPAARMIRDHLDAGGRRLRARIALATYEALGGRGQDAVDWAAAVELLHNASLVHDDVQDGDRTRRGQPALWAKYGTAQAINAGDLLLMLPFRALRGYPPETQAVLMQIVAESAENTARGQILELGLTGSQGRDWDDYLRAATGKTGTLFGLPARGAAHLASVASDDAAKIALCVSEIGVLYQLQDDLLDLFDAKGRGVRCSDIYEGRLTALVLTHLDLHPGEAPDVFYTLCKQRDATTPDEVARLANRFIRGGAARELLSRIESLAAELLGSEVWSQFPEVQAVADGLVDRVLEPVHSLKGSIS